MTNPADNPLYVYLHIPKSGGTTLLWSIGQQYDRTNDRYLKHYHWMNTQLYLYNNLPILERRTVEQQKQLKFITGHGTYNMVQYWLKVRKQPFLFTTFRDPIDRLLSSFNYRYGVSELSQDRQNFTMIDPPMDIHARFNTKYPNDYSTLYEWYLDASSEQNLQTKWMIKSFYTHYDNRFVPWEAVVKRQNPADSAPDIWPEWFENVQPDQDMFNNVQDIVKNKLWWAGTSDTLSADIPELCKYTGVDYVNVDNRHRSGIDFPRYWTRADVEAQPDFENLLRAEKWDIKLYNYVKHNCKRPF